MNPSRPAQWDRYATLIGVDPAQVHWEESTDEQRDELLHTAIGTLLNTTNPAAITTPPLIWWHGTVPDDTDTTWETTPVPGWNGTLDDYLAALLDDYATSRHAPAPTPSSELDPGIHWGEQTMTREQIAQVAHQAGFRGEALVAMVGIAWRESGGHPQLYVNRPSTGDWSYGLWGLNVGKDMQFWPQFQSWGINSPDELRTPLGNARAAFGMYQQMGERPWGPYKGKPWTYSTDQVAARAAVDNAARQGLLGQPWPDPTTTQDTTAGPAPKQDDHTWDDHHASPRRRRRADSQPRSRRSWPRSATSRAATTTPNRATPSPPTAATAAATQPAPTSSSTPAGAATAATAKRSWPHPASKTNWPPTTSPHPRRLRRRPGMGPHRLVRRNRRRPQRPRRHLVSSPTSPTPPTTSISIGDYQARWLDYYTTIALPAAGGTPAVCPQGGQAAVAWAETQLGAPYAAASRYRFGDPPWPGGTLIGDRGDRYTYPAGTIVYDCSGFVIAAWRAAGVDLVAQYGLYGSQAFPDSPLEEIDPSAVIPATSPSTRVSASGVGHIVMIHHVDPDGTVHVIEATPSRGVHIGTIDWSRVISIKRPPSPPT